VVEQEIVDWHSEGKVAEGPKMTAYKPAAPVAPKAIDTRSLSMEKPKPVFQPLIPKPVPKISLDNLKNSSNNQRKPDVKNVSALRDALKAVVGDKPTTNDQRPTKKAVEPPLGGSTAKLGPSPEELKKILHGE